MVSKLNPDGAQHSEQHYVTVSVENIAVHTVYAKYLVLTFGKVLHKFFYLRYAQYLRLCSMWSSLNAKLAPG